MQEPSQQTPNEHKDAGFDDAAQNTEIVPTKKSSTHTIAERSTLMVGVIWCLIGGFAMPVSHFLSVFMVAYGSTILLKSRDARRLPIVLALVIIPAVMRVQGLEMGRELLLSSMIFCGLSVAVGYFMARTSFSLEKEMLLVVAVFVLMMGTDAILSYAEGRALGDTILQLFDKAAQELNSQNIAVQLEIQALRSRIELMWPMVYVLNAFISVLAAHLGAKLASNKLGLKKTALKLEAFRLPLWIVIIPIGALICLGLSTTQLTNFSQQLYFVGLNVFNVLRIPLSFQALGLIVFFAKEKDVSKFAVAGLFFVGIVLELSFYALSVLGLIDLWADFRALYRTSVSPTRS